MTTARVIAIKKYRNGGFMFYGGRWMPKKPAAMYLVPT